MAGNPKAWPQEHVEALWAMIGAAGGGSYVDIANRLNATFGTSYTRHSCIGRAHRMGLCKPQQYGPSAQAIANRRERKREYKSRQREKRAARPKFQPGTPQTSVVYRNRLPRVAMTKTEMRAMLTVAVRNTAAMGVA